MKVKLSKKVAEAIEYFRNNEQLKNDEIVWQAHQVDQHTNQVEVIRDYAADNYDDFLRALVNGYEVQQTTEDMVRQLYSKYSGSDDRKYRGMAIGIKETLDILNIKIQGVNAE